MVHIHSATVEIRQGKKERKKTEEETTMQNIMACPIPYGGHNYSYTGRYSVMR